MTIRRNRQLLHLLVFAAGLLGTPLVLANIGALDLIGTVRAIPATMGALEVEVVAVADPIPVPDPSPVTGTPSAPVAEAPATPVPTVPPVTIVAPPAMPVGLVLTTIRMR